MLNFLKQVGDYAKETAQAAKYIGQGLSVTFDHMRRRPISVQYPYEKLIPSERYRGRIHFEFDKCIKKKELKHYSIDFGVCIFCGNCVEYCPTNCLSMTEEYELATYDRHDLNYDSVALGRLPYKVTDDPMVTPLRELAYLPKGEMDPHGVDPKRGRAGQRPEEIVAAAQKEASKGESNS